MKVIIEEDEWYPVYSIETSIDEYNMDTAVEMDDALVARIQDCMTEFQELQDILREVEKP